MKTENIEKLNSLEIYQKVAFEFKDGWNGLVYELGKDIEDLCKLANCELPLIQQIKEKFGTLRFYYNTLNSQYPKIIEKSIRALVSQAKIVHLLFVKYVENLVKKELMVDFIRLFVKSIKEVQ